MRKKIKKQEELVKKKLDIIKKNSDGFRNKDDDTCYVCGRKRYHSKGMCLTGFACNFTPGLEKE